jgi:non-ribosomal peptide synthase protein (TIGR01720 family)
VSPAKSAPAATAWPAGISTIRRGFRIEPGEIEAVLQQHPAVGETIVVATPTSVGTTELAAYYTTRSPLEPAELRAFLTGSLPAYMVPAHLIALDTMPIAFTGKIDRRALPPPSAAEAVVRSESEQPRDAREALLAQVWSGVLGRDGIGIYDDYFELGGDSIKSIQMSSRLRQAGWKLEMRDLFEHPQIVELAPRLRPLEAAAERQPVTGTVPLTPVQQWFFEEHRGALDHFNMSMLLRVRGPLDEGALRAALQAVWDHHDALRLTYRPVAGALEQAPGAGGPVHFEVLDASDGARLGQTLNLRSGPLFKAALLRSTGDDRLLLVFHHLVVDAVSLRIIIEDLERAYRGLALPAATDSFQQWARHLIRWAQSEDCTRQAEYWHGVLAGPAHELTPDRPDGTNDYGDCRSVDFVFPPGETAAILSAASAGFDVPTLLLTALGRALRTRHGADTTLVLLEGHGREPLERGVDVDRTTGWFTTMYPVRLDVSGTDPRAQLERVDETLRRIPHNGIGFGVARYLGPVDVQQRLGGKLPAIAFNYLGEFADSAEGATFQLQDQGPGAPVDPALQRRNELDVVGVVIDKSLRLSLTFSEQRFERATIEQLASAFRSEIETLVAACAGAPRARRPARARFAGVNEGDLANILGEPR